MPDKLPRRRRAKGTNILLPIATDQEYRAAVIEVEQLLHAPLGTPATEGLQELVEAILDYEERLGSAPED